jgi:hypothetical protein
VEWKEYYDPETQYPKHQEHPDSYTPVLQDSEHLFIAIAHLGNRIL